MGILRKKACPDALEVHPGSRAKQTLDKLLGAHFQTEDGNRDVFVDGNMLRNVHRECGLSHRGARRDDDHLARVHTAGHIVENLESGGNSGYLTLVLVEFFDRIDGGVDVFLDVGQVAPDTILGNCEDLLLDIIDERLHIPLLVVTARCRSGADGNHAAQEMLLPHNVDVVFGIGGGWQEGLESCQKGRSSDLLEEIPIRQGLRDGDQVDRTILLPEIFQDGIDRPMSGMVEVLIIDPLLDGCSECILRGEQDGREDTFLRIKTGR